MHRDLDILGGRRRHRRLFEVVLGAPTAEVGDGAEAIRLVELDYDFPTESCWWVHPTLIGGLEHGFYELPYVGNFMIPTDFHSIIFQRGRAQPPTHQPGNVNPGWKITMVNYGKSPCSSWENPLFRLGHFQ